MESIHKQTIITYSLLSFLWVQEEIDNYNYEFILYICTVQIPV